jgi:hypothetical protein
MGITASTSPCHECEPKSHEHRLRIHLHLRSRHHTLVLICHITVHACTTDFLSTLSLYAHPRALVSDMLLVCILSASIYI